MKKKKILCIATAGLVTLAGTSALGINAVYPQAYEESSGTGASGKSNASAPDGSEQGAPPEKPDGSGQGMPPEGGPGGAGMPGGAASEPDSYSSVNTYTQNAEVSDETITSTGTDENAVLVQNGVEVSMENVTLNRNSSDSTGGDASSFYGIGAGMLVTDGTLNVSGSTINTDAKGGAGVFAYKNGTVNISDTVIHTKQDTSGGIHAAGGGTVNASNLTVTTEGGSSAAIRSDRGGGTMNVNGGTYTSNGSGSPAVYCTADITVKDAQLTANDSEAVCIEGLNSLKLTDCSLTGNMPQNDQNDCTWNVILYQSMSGDSQVGNSTFSMDGGTLTAKNGGMFYTTNTESTFELSNVNIQYADQNDFFLKCTGNSNARGWGAQGSNGADCTFTAKNQKMQGDIIWDSISTLNFSMSDGSVLTGAVVQDESNVKTAGSGYADITIDASSKWVVTGNSTVRKLNSKGTITDSEGNTVTVELADGTVISKGNSKYKITAESASVADTSIQKSKVKKVSKTVMIGKTAKVTVGSGAKITDISNKKAVKVSLKGNQAVIKVKKAAKSVITVKNGDTTYKITVKGKKK